MTPIDSGKNTLTFKRITSQIKSKSNYFSYSVLGSIILFFKQLVYSQYLGVVEFGFYSIFLLTFAYGSYSMGLGFNQGLLRFLPEARLQEKERYVNVIRNNVITASLIIGVIEAIIFIPATFLFVEDSRLSFVLIYAIIYTIINMQINLYTIDFIGKCQFSLYSKLHFFRAFFLFFGGGVFLALGYGLFTMLLLEILISLTTLYLIKRFYIVKARYQFDNINVVFGIMKKGIGFWGVDVVKGLLSSLDKIVIVSFFPMVIIGSYSFSMIIFTISVVASGILSTLLKPLFINKLSKTGSKIEIFHSTLTISLIILIIGAIIGGILLNVFEWAILNYYPEYKIGASYLLPIIISCIFFIANIYESALLAFDAGRSFFKLNFQICMVYIFIVAISITQNAEIFFYLYLFTFVQLLLLIMNFLLTRKIAYKDVKIKVL